MKKILLVYLPFCTPASPPYSITSLYSFLKANSKEDISVIDLNIEFHKLKFPDQQKYFKDIKLWKNYDKAADEYNQLSAKVYSENNKRILNFEKPEFFDELLKKIIEKKPDVLAFSIVYSSQAFFASSILNEIKKFLPDLTTVLGGPSLNVKIVKQCDRVLNNEIELLELIDGKAVSHEDLKLDFHVDFSAYNLNDYFTPEPVIPIKTSSTCYYKKCTFCAHYNKTDYYEFPIKQIKTTIKKSGQKHFFFIDDMVPAKRLLKIGEELKELNIKWSIQLKPTKDFDLETLKKLRESGLVMIMWGIESGSQRILDLMKKGTIFKDVEKVVENSHAAGIKNIAYLMFGFPTETTEEFLETINFLKQHEPEIDLVNVSVFGLQEGTPIYKNPKEYGIIKVHEKERTLLGPIITYEVERGMSQELASDMKKRYKRTLEKINKFPKSMNFFREHMLCRIE